MKAIFYHSNILQRPFLYPYFNTVKIWWSLEVFTRVFHSCQFLDAILYNLAKYVDGQYKVNAKKFRFLSHEMSRRHNIALSAIFTQKRPRVAIFWPKKITKILKNFKNILNRLKIIVEQKEKRFWKAFWKKVHFRLIFLKKYISGWGFLKKVHFRLNF